MKNVLFEQKKIQSSYNRRVVENKRNSAAVLKNAVNFLVAYIHNISLWGCFYVGVFSHQKVGFLNITQWHASHIWLNDSRNNIQILHFRVP